MVLKKRVLLLPMTVLVLSAAQCQPPPASPPPKPHFNSFTAGPNPVCLNQTAFPILQIQYSIDTSGWMNPGTCMILEVDGAPLHNDVCVNLDLPLNQPPPPTLSGSHPLNVATHYGGHVPPTIDLAARLTNSVTGAIYDEASTTVQTRNDCPPPGLIP